MHLELVLPVCYGSPDITGDDVQTSEVRSAGDRACVAWLAIMAVVTAICRSIHPWRAKPTVGIGEWYAVGGPRLAPSSSPQSLRVLQWSGASSWEITVITSIRLRDFKGFRDETLRLGPFTVLVGANATGKSNMRDALRFLHGVSRGYTLAEIIGGRHGGGEEPEWEQIRGGPNEIIRMESQDGAGSKHPLPAFSMQVNMVIADIEYIYEIEVSRDVADVHQFRIASESLRVNSHVVYETHRDTPDDHTSTLATCFSEYTIQLQSYPEEHRRIPPAEASMNQPILHQMKEHQYAKELRLAVEPVMDALSKCRFLNFSPDCMRTPSFPRTPLGERGENIASALKEICFDKQRDSILKSWLSELMSMDIQGFEFRNDSSERVHFMIQEGTGKLLSVHSISDGMLKFLAMAATLLNNDESNFYVIDNIESGIHPARLYLLADFFERNTYTTNTQVLATTHSPALLNVVNDRTFEQISVACRLEGSDASIIRSITDLPNVRKLRTSHGLGRLMSGGWMETTLDFMEDRVD